MIYKRVMQSYENVKQKLSCYDIVDCNGQLFLEKNKHLIYVANYTPYSQFYVPFENVENILKRVGLDISQFVERADKVIENILVNRMICSITHLEKSDILYCIKGVPDLYLTSVGDMVLSFFDGPEYVDPTSMSSRHLSLENYEFSYEMKELIAPYENGKFIVRESTDIPMGLTLMYNFCIKNMLCDIFVDIDEIIYDYI